MTIERLLEELRKQREQLSFSIGLIESRIDGERSKVKRKAIVKAAKPVPPNMKGHKYNGTHWMQRSENKAKMLSIIKKMQKGQRLARQGK